MPAALQARVIAVRNRSEPKPGNTCVVISRSSRGTISVTRSNSTSGTGAPRAPRRASRSRRARAAAGGSAWRGGRGLRGRGLRSQGSLRRDPPAEASLACRGRDSGSVLHDREPSRPHNGLATAIIVVLLRYWRQHQRKGGGAAGEFVAPSVRIRAVQSVAGNRAGSRCASAVPPYETSGAPVRLESAAEPCLFSSSARPVLISATCLSPDPVVAVASEPERWELAALDRPARSSCGGTRRPPGRSPLRSGTAAQQQPEERNHAATVAIVAVHPGRTARGASTMHTSGATTRRIRTSVFYEAGIGWRICTTACSWPTVAKRRPDSKPLQGLGSESQSADCRITRRG
jgi:hypothetical protein